ncbi:MAG: pilus assembly protein PilM [Planctomycetota bacterium]
MQTAIVIDAGEIRLGRIDQGALTTLERYPLSGEGDPLSALAAAPLPRPLGPVVAVLQHQDLLVKPMIQPPAPRDRLERIVRFELQSIVATGSADEFLFDWHIPATGGLSTEMRIVALVAKRNLVDQLRAAIADHGGKLVGVMLPAEALFHAYRQQQPADEGNVLVVDIARGGTQCAIVSGGDLLFVRPGSGGFDELAQDIGGMRGLELDDSRQMLMKLGEDVPDDLTDRIRRHAGALASTLSNHIRFARAQLRLESFDLEAVYLAGEGAQIPHLVPALAERIHAPCRALNPFAGQISRLGTSDMDQQAQLPSPWTSAIAAARCERRLLDPMHQVKQERRAFWQTRGALRLGAIAIGAMLALAWIMLTWRDHRLDALHQELRSGETPLVPRAEQARKRYNAVNAEIEQQRGRVAALDQAHLPARVGTEVLNVIASLQDPRNTRIFLTEYAVARRQPGEVVLGIRGYAQDSVNTRAAKVLDGFKRSLQQAYPAMEEPLELNQGISSDRLSFDWGIIVPDREL